MSIEGDLENGIQRSLGRMEGKVDVLISSFASHAKDDDIQFAKIDSRLTVMERIVYWFTGVGALFVLGVTVFLQWYPKK